MPDNACNQTTAWTNGDWTTWGHVYMADHNQATDATGDDGGCANTRNAHAAVVGVPSATAPEQTTDRRDPWFPDDDEVREITSQAYALSEAHYPKNEGQGYFEDLLIRSTIGICRNKYQMADEKTTIWRCPECGSSDCPSAFNHVPFRPAYWQFWMMRALLWIMHYAKKVRVHRPMTPSV